MLEAFAVTCAAVFALAVLALFGKFDITTKGHVLAMAGGVIFMVAIVTFLVAFFYGEASHCGSEGMGGGEGWMGVPAVLERMCG